MTSDNRSEPIDLNIGEVEGECINGPAEHSMARDNTSEFIDVQSNQTEGDCTETPAEINIKLDYLKTNLLFKGFNEFHVRSFADLGGCYGVHGGYT